MLRQERGDLFPRRKIIEIHAVADREEFDPARRTIRAIVNAPIVIEVMAASISSSVTLKPTTLMR